MRKKDIALSIYFEDEERYADLINGFVFGGKQVVKAEDIVEKDAVTTGIIHRLKKRLGIRKYRDMIRKVVLDTDFVLMGLENQDSVHYAMPVRVMMMDAAGYSEQLRKLQKRHRRNKDLKGAEYLSGFTKQDRLRPVITIVLYHGRDPWDGARDLYQVFGFLQRSGDKNAEKEFTFQNQDLFMNIEEDAYDVIAELSGSKELEDAKERYREEGGTVNMCEAIRGMIEDGRLEGRIEKSRTAARNMYLRGMSPEDAAAICEENVELVRQWYKSWNETPDHI